MLIPQVYIGENWYSLDEVFKSYSNVECGGVNIFIGVARSAPEDGKVKELHYEAYIPMAEKVIKEIIQEAKEKFKINHAIVHHRTGVVPVGVASFLVVVWAGHRQEAFSGCRYIVDNVKARAPIWKKEVFETGQSIWKEQ